MDIYAMYDLLLGEGQELAQLEWELAGDWVKYTLEFIARG